MIREHDIAPRFKHWAGFVGGVLAGGLSHQIGSHNLFRDCAATGRPTVLLAAAIGFVLVGVGAYLSWTVIASSEDAPSRRLAAGVSLITAALVAFSILLPTLYSLIVPACFA
jgi:hypothetical protein